MASAHPDPRPRPQATPYTPFVWPSGDVTPLEPGASTYVDLASLSRNRQTRREFRHLSLQQLGHLLWLACRVHSSTPSPFGFDQQFRPLPSAGALHPIHVLLQRQREADWEIYDPEQHILVSVPVSAHLASEARRTADDTLYSGDATLIGFVAEPGKSGAKYINPESLVWRDAGVIIGYLSLFGEALGLSICPLGPTGDDILSRLSDDGLLRGAGLMLIGA